MREAAPNRGDIAQWQREHDAEQMLSWLAWCEAQYGNPKYRTTQTERGLEMGGKRTRSGAYTPVGSQINAPYGMGDIVKTSTKRVLNTWALYKDWCEAERARLRAAHPDWVKHRIRIRYEEALPECKAFLDFLDDQEGR